MRNELRRQLFDVRALEDSRTNEGGIPSFTNNNFKENVENMKGLNSLMQCSKCKSTKACKILLSLHTF